MTDPARKRIFLSYGRKDDNAENEYDDPAKSFMRRLYTDLINHYDVWWDRENLPSRGLEFLPEIARAIESCAQVVLIVGPHAVASDYVAMEWRYALDNCLPVTPLLRKGDGYELIPHEIGQLNALDFRDDTKYTERLDDLLRILSDEDVSLGTLYGTPLLPAGYIRRDQPLRELSAKIRTDAHAPVIVTSEQKVMALYGIGGIGKTTLVAAVSRECDVRRYFTDGVFWLEMGQNAQVVDRMGDVGTTFGDAREDYQDVRSATVKLSARLHNKHALIVLDDVWDHTHAKPFMDAMGTCRVVMTTRQGGFVTTLGATGQLLAKLSEDEGLVLIYTRCATLEDHDVALRKVVRLLDGHTLAISLAAAWLVKQGIRKSSELLQRLERGRVFTDLPLDDKDKNLNVEKSLALSYADLDADNQRRFRATGIFPAGSTFDRSLAAAVWGDADEFDAENALAALVDEGILEKTDDDRYQRHGLLRTYAHALLKQANELDAVFVSYAEWVIGAAEAFNELPLEEWGQLDPLLPHVQEVGDALANQLEEAGEYAAVELTERVGQFAVNVKNYVYSRPQVVETSAGRVLRGLNWLEAGLDSFRRSGEQKRESLMLNQIALVWDDLGEKRKALDYYEQALPLDRAMGDRGGEAVTLNNIGKVWDALGEKRKALDYFEQAIPLYQALGDRGKKATTLSNMGVMWRQLGDNEKALDYYEQALTLVRAVGDRGGEAVTLNNIGMLWNALGEKLKALDYYEQALPLRRVVGDRRGEAATLNNIASIQFQEGQPEQAVETMQQIVTVVSEIGDVAAEATYRVNLAVYLRQMGQVDEAIAQAEQSVALLRRYNLPQDVAGQTLQMHEAFLAQLQRERDGG